MLLGQVHCPLNDRSVYQHDEILSFKMVLENGDGRRRFLRGYRAYSCFPRYSRDNFHPGYKSRENVVP